MSNKTQIGALVIDLRADISHLRREMQAGQDTVRRSVDEISNQQRRLSEGFRRSAVSTAGLRKELAGLRAPINDIRGLMGRLGGDATGAMSSLGLMGRDLLGAFGSGGLIAVGIAGVVAGISALVSHVKEARKETDQLSALSAKFGVTAQDIKSIRTSFRAAGLDIDAGLTAKIVTAGREAGLASDQIAVLGREIKAVADLGGLDPEAAANKMFAGLRGHLGDVIKDLDEAIAKKWQLIHGTDPVRAQAEKALKSAREEMEKYNAALATNAEQQQKISGQITRFDEQQKKRRNQGNFLVGVSMQGKDSVFKDEIFGVDARLDAVNKRKELEEESKWLEGFIAAEQRRMEKAQEKLAEFNLVDGLGVFRDRTSKASKEIERELQAGFSASEREQKALMDGAIKSVQAWGAEIAEQEKLQAAILARVADALHATQAIHAGLTVDRTDDIRVSYDRQLALLQRRIDDELTAEAEKAALLQQMDALRAARDRDLETERQIASRRREDAAYETEAIYVRLGGSRISEIKMNLARELEMVRRSEQDKLLTYEDAKARRVALERQASEEIAAEQQQAVTNASLTGIGIADAIANGMREGFRAKNWKDIFKSLLGMISRVASFIPGGGSVVSAGASLFAGFFADGGLIRGPGTGTSDSILARVSNREYIQPAHAVERFGVRFMDRLRDGVLDLSALPAFATGGLVGATAGGGSMAAMPSGGSSRTEINVSAFDPKSMLEVIGQVVEPAAYRRGSNRSGAKHTSGLRRQVAAPRHGRQA